MKKHMNTAIILVCLSSHFVFAMQEKIFTNNQIVLNLVAVDYLFDPEAISSFAATSKYNNQLLISMAQNRRRKLSTCPVYHPLSTLLHTYGTACCYAFQPSEFDELTVSYHELNADKAITKYAKLQGFISPLWHKQSLFFDTEQNICFYGYGRVECNHKEVLIEGIFKFCIDGSSHYCILDKKIDPAQHGLHSFLLYPSLLQSILQSSGRKTVFEPTHYAIPSVEYSFDETLIPQDYTNKVPTPFIDKKRYHYLSVFEKIPDSIMIHIEKRLQEQAQSKNASL